MALDFNGIKLLLWAKNLGATFERTLTLGRQGFVCTPRRMRRAARDFGLTVTADQVDQCFCRAPNAGLTADGFFRLIGANEIVSVDLSDFEGATLLHDLNEPFPETERGRFDFVFDGGTLEHIFNYPMALRHCLELVRPGGHFLTIAPAHNHMGHGFYQVSPELFFRVFSAGNGFALRKIVLYDASRTDATFYQVNDPALTGHRTALVSPQPMFLAALAQRMDDGPVLARVPQQSDYASDWEVHRAKSKAPLPRPGPFRRIRTFLNPYWPFWLLNLKNALIYTWRQGAPKLSNRRHFSRLRRAEICRERSDGSRLKE